MILFTMTVITKWCQVGGTHGQSRVRCKNDRPWTLWQSPMDVFCSSNFGLMAWVETASTYCLGKHPFDGMIIKVGNT